MHSLLEVLKQTKLCSSFRAELIPTALCIAQMVVPCLISNIVPQAQLSLWAAVQFICLSIQCMPCIDTHNPKCTLVRQKSARTGHARRLDIPPGRSHHHLGQHPVPTTRSLCLLGLCIQCAAVVSIPASTQHVKGKVATVDAPFTRSSVSAAAQGSMCLKLRCLGVDRCVMV